MLNIRNPALQGTAGRTRINAEGTTYALADLNCEPGLSWRSDDSEQDSGVVHDVRGSVVS